MFIMFSFRILSLGLELFSQTSVYLRFCSTCLVLLAFFPFSVIDLMSRGDKLVLETYIQHMKRGKDNEREQ